MNNIVKFRENRATVVQNGFQNEVFIEYQRYLYGNPWSMLN